MDEKANGGGPGRLQKEAGRTALVVVGRTANGRAFRPSDWAQRLCGAAASFCPSRRIVLWSPRLSPGDYEGFPAVFVDEELRTESPEVFEFVKAFARDNGLDVVDAVCAVPQRGGVGGRP